MNWRAFCMSGAFLGFTKGDNVVTGVGLPPFRTLEAEAKAATRAAGLAVAANAVPCWACKVLFITIISLFINYIPYKIWLRISIYVCCMYSFNAKYKY